MAELKPVEYKRKFHEPSVLGSETVLDNSLEIGIQSLKTISKCGRAAVYPDTEEGFQLFADKIVSFFRYVQEINKQYDDDRDKLLPSVELLSQYCGISRMTLLKYEKNRGEEWRELIRRAKDMILACQEELAFHGKFNPVLLIFTSCNNHGYVSTNQITVTNEVVQNEKGMSIDQLPDLRKREE